MRVFLYALALAAAGAIEFGAAPPSPPPDQMTVSDRTSPAGR